MFGSQFSSDQWHHEAEDIARRNGIRSRRWGMRVTVYNDANPANNGDYILSYALANTNRQSNSNWLKVADIGETWGGGGSVYTFSNGLTLYVNNVSLGGLLDVNTTIDGDTNGYDLNFLNIADFNVTSSTVNIVSPDFELSNASMSLRMFEGAFIDIAGTDPVLISVNDGIGQAQTQTSLGGASYGYITNDNALFRFLGITVDEITARGDSTFAGIKYEVDVSPNYVARSLTDYEFNTTHIGEQAVDALVINPTVTQNGYVIAWNNSNLEYELVPQSGGGVSFGTSAQIPFMNPGGTDFSYEAGFEYSSGANLFIAPALQLNNSATAGGGVITTQSSSADANLTLNAKGNGTIIAANQFFQISTDFVIDGATGEITTTGDITIANTGNVRIVNSLEVPDIFNLLALVGTDGHSSNEDGFQLSLTAGNAYTVSGNGDGGNALIQSGQKRAAGAGLDGNIVLNTWNGNLAFADASPDFEGGQRIIYIQDSTAQPSASPTNGMFMYSVNGELQVLNETGPTLSLAGRATIVTESGTSVSLTAAHRGAIVKLTNAGAVTITLSDLGNNYTTTLLYTGTTSVSFAGYDNFFSVGSADQILDQYGMVFLLHETSNDWYAKGDLS